MNALTQQDIRLNNKTYHKGGTCLPKQFRTGSVYLIYTPRLDVQLTEVSPLISGNISKTVQSTQRPRSTSKDS